MIERHYRRIASLMLELPCKKMRKKKKENIENERNKIINTIILIRARLVHRISAPYYIIR